MSSAIKKIDLFSYYNPRVGRILDEKQPENAVVYSSAYKAQNTTKTQEDFTRPIYKAMKEALLVDKTFDPEQEATIGKRIKEIVAEAANNLGLSSLMGQNEIKISDLQKLRDEVKRIVLCVGNKKPLFHPPEAGEELTAFQKVFQTLLSDQLSPSGVVNGDTAPAIFWGRDPKALKDARSYVQTILNRFDTSDAREPTLAESASIENLLALYPFFDPPEGEALIIPEWTGTEWKRVPFTVQRLQLTQSWLASPMFAYGLVPKEKGICPKLLFKGTTYPADRGAFLSILSDVNPGASVGEYAFHMGFSSLEEWFAKYTTPECKADVFGQSLGGSLTLLAASYFGEKIRKAHAFGSPAPWPWSVSKFDSIPEQRRPDVRIFSQSGDGIPKLGWGWHAAWKVHRVFAGEDYGAFLSHAKAFTAEKGVLILDVKSEADSSGLSRKALAITQLVLSFILFVLAVVVFTIHRIIYAVYHRIKVTILSIAELRHKEVPKGLVEV